MGQLDSDLEPADVLILGASARAAAMSARRAGFRVWAIDQFGDADLAEMARQYRRVNKYQECLSIIANWPNMPCFVTGALENHPRLLERLAKDRPFWGTPADEVRQLRNPRRLQETLHQASLPALEIWDDPSSPPANGQWMLKPRRSAGGQGVFVWDQTTVDSREASITLQKPHLFQQRAEGEVGSAVFLSEWDQITFVGASRLIQAKVPGPRFGYGGAVGPISLSPEMERQLLEIGQTIGAAFHLRGLWGLDFVSDGFRLFVTEVNPRYTATVELYEHAFGAKLLQGHRQACENWPSEDNERRNVSIKYCNKKPSRSICVGKVVIYASREFIVPPWKEWATRCDELLPELRVLADRPAEGSQVPKGFPICSLFATGSTENDGQAQLQHRLESFKRHFVENGIQLRF